MQPLTDSRRSWAPRIQTILPRWMFMIPVGMAVVTFGLWPVGPVSAQSPQRRDHAALGVFLKQERDGVSVTEVLPGSPAERAGIVTGDEIRSIGDDRILTARDLTDEMATLAPGTHVDLTIRRDGRRQIVTVDLADWATTFKDRATPPEARRPAGQSNRSYSFDPKNARPSTAAEIEARRMRILEQRIARLQQQLNALRYSQQVNRPAVDPDFPNKVRRGETDNDPAVFQ